MLHKMQFYSYILHFRYFHASNILKQYLLEIRISCTHPIQDTIDIKVIRSAEYYCYKSVERIKNMTFDGHNNNIYSILL